VKPIVPGATIGILGGGQLGRMITFAARRMGYRVAILSADPAAPAAQVADEQIEGDLADPEAVLRLADRSDVVTLETEHIPAQTLSQVERIRPLHPSAAVLRTVQDRLKQKQFLDRHGLPQARYAPAGSERELARAADRIGFPSILKTRRAGYDGKGQARISDPGELKAAWQRVGAVPCVLEAVVPFEREISVMVARDVRGCVTSYGVAENVHHNHVLHTTVAPARLRSTLCSRAIELARYVVQALKHVGVMGVEMFLRGDDELLINEIAPRTHNSGHYTLGACVTCQFEQHVRAICGLPLGDATQMRPAVMLNLLGDLWSAGPPRWEPVLSRGDVRLHLYGKTRALPGRKMGHLLVFGNTPEQGLRLAQALHRSLVPQTTGEIRQGALRCD
jgi:5-(carboxyamino)imidazole ribonucleotide synthase